MEENLTCCPVETKDLIRKLQLIYFAMILGPTLFMIVANLAPPSELSVDTGVDELFLLVIPIVGSLSVGGGFLLFRKQLSKLKELASPRAKMEGYLTFSIIRYACIEGPVLLSVLAFLITRNPVFIAFFFLGMICNGLIIPSGERISRDLETDSLTHH